MRTWFIAEHKREAGFFNNEPSWPLNYEEGDAFKANSVEGLKQMIFHHWDDKFNNPDDYDYFRIDSTITPV